MLSSRSFVMRHELLPVELSFNMAISRNPICPTYGLPFLFMLQCSCWSRKFVLHHQEGRRYGHLSVYTGICSWWITYLWTSHISRLIPSKWPFTSGDFLNPGENVQWWSMRVASEIRNPYLMLLIGWLHHYLAQGEALFDCFQCISSIKN